MEIIKFNMWNKYYSCVLHILTFLHMFNLVYSFNLNTDLAKVFVGKPNSYFGYTTDFLQTKDSSKTKWILVGAPTDQDQFTNKVNKTGALYKCYPNDNHACEQIQIAKSADDGTIELDGNKVPIINERKDSWLGVSLAIGDAVTVCAHRWVNKIEEKKVQTPMYYMNGICYEIPTYLAERNAAGYALLSKDTNYANPPNDLQQINDTNGKYFHYQYGQMGTSVQYSIKSSQNTFIGAPGLRDAAGGLIEFTPNSVGIASETYDPDRNNDYFGYALAVGYFLGIGAEYVALGGPRGNGTGQVKIVRMNGNSYNVIDTISGEETGSYFGGVVCAVNMTSKHILVVGAPFYGNLTNQNIDLNNINQDEGKVYVYSYDNTKGKMVELQQLKATGQNTRNARFGSAITSPGDINSDGAYDLAVGAPYEDNGIGVVYIFNGHNGMFWSRPTQIIKGRSFTSHNLMGFGLYLSQNQMDVDNNKFNDLLIGAPNSDNVVLLKSNPTISMDVSLKTNLKSNIIYPSGNDTFNIKVCFNYPGNTDLPADITVRYTVDIDNKMTEDNRRERVLARDGSHTVSGDKKIFKGLTSDQCSDPFEMVLQQYRSDIVTPVTFIVRYAITQLAGTGINCTVTPCPVINVFNAGRQIPDAAFFEEMINFKKPGCGEDNICQPDLSLQVVPHYNYESTNKLIRGPEAGFQLDLTVTNNGPDASYGTTLTIDSENFISYTKVVPKDNSQGTVSCSPQNVEDDRKSILECSLSDLETPFQTGRVDRFTIYFDASKTPVVPTFNVDVNLKTRSSNINLVNNKRLIPMTVQSKADVVFDGVGNPELYVTSKTQGDTITHRFDFTNQGPSVLSTPTTFSVAYPNVVINLKEVLKIVDFNFTIPVESSLDCGPDIVLTMVKVEKDSSGTNSTRTYQLTEKYPSAIADDLNYNCESQTCKSVKCTTAPLGVKAFVTVLLKYDMDPTILSQVQTKSKIESLPIVSVASASLPTNILLPESSLSYTTMGKTDVVPAEQVKKEVAWWVVLLGILGGLAFLAVVAFILWKVGFFRRKHKEDLEEMKKKGKGKKYEQTDEEKLIENGKKEPENEPSEPQVESKPDIPNDTSP